jgi:hypothetical protein
MAEAIGLIASVVQVAGAGLKLSQTLYQYADGVATADRRIKDIAKEIELTSGVIDELGDIFKQDETASLISKNAVKTANETMNECSVVFAEIEATLAKSKKGRMGRLMLPFRDSKIDLLRSHIDKLKDTLQLLMQVLTHAHLVSSKKLDREAEAKQREEIKQLLENKKQSTKRYEESLKNFSISDGSTAVDDDQESDKLEEDASNSTAALTVAASALASTISPETLAKCVDHVRNLLQNIETLQQALATKVDGDDHSDHHQRAVGSYFRARSHLDNILLGNSKAGTPNSGGPVPSSFEHVQNGIQVAMPMRAQERSEASDHAGFAKKKARAEDRERARAKAETREKVAKLAETLVRKEMMKGEQRPKEEHEMRVAQAKPQVELEELRKRAEIEHGEFKEHEREARRREIEMGSGPPRPTATRRLTRSSPVHDPSAPAYLIPLPDVAAGSSPPHSHTLEDGRKTSADNAVAADDLHVHKERDIWEGSETYTKRDITAGALAEVGAGQIIKHHRKRKGESAGGNIGYALRYGALDAVGYIRRDGEVYDDDEVYEEYQGYNGEGKGKLPAPVSDEFSDHPTGIGSSLPSQPSEAPITEDDRVNQQMALLLAKTDSPTSPNTNAWASTFGIDLPRDREQHLDKHMRSQELVGTPVAYKAAELPELPDEKRQQEALWRQAQDTKAFEREARRPARREAPRRQARREAHPWSLVRHGSAGSQESQAAPSAIDSPTTHGTGTYPIQQRRPSESRSRSSTRKVSKPEIIIQIGSMKGKSRASHFRHTSSVSCSSKAYKRSSLGQSAPSDTVPELQRPPVEPPVTIAEADSPPTYPKIPDDIHYRPGSLSPYLRTSVDASKPSAARIRLPPPISFPPGITFPPKLPAVFQDSRIGSYRTTVVAPTSVERHSDAYSPTPPDLPILDLDAEASTGDEDTGKCYMFRPVSTPKGFCVGNIAEDIHALCIALKVKTLSNNIPYSGR